ncbi:restriction endonuclease [Leucobacter sp. W1478]|uniref:restriction endonuclease n=1 Tax=Leucobacter sp. W1478 TaxID=3439065 RepID=UPI003F2EF887
MIAWTEMNSEAELRKLLQEASPEFFERAVLEVLWSMGYGGGQGQKEHLGKTSDRGIDGVIRQDPLGLQKVYAQAKRYADDNTVGSPDINGFYGARARRGADRGVFMTSSRFSPAAREAADQFGGKIILIDGLQLTSLMLQYGEGVESKAAFTLYSVDKDFFALD